MTPLAREAIQPVTGATFGRGNCRDYNAIFVFANLVNDQIRESTDLPNAKLPMGLARLPSPISSRRRADGPERFCNRLNEVLSQAFLSNLVPPRGADCLPFRSVQNLNVHDAAGERGTCGVSPRTLRRGENSPDPHQMLRAALRSR